MAFVALLCVSTFVFWLCREMGLRQPWPGVALVIGAGVAVLWRNSAEVSSANESARRWNSVQLLALVEAWRRSVVCLRCGEISDTGGRPGRS